MSLLDAERSVVVIVDMQGKLVGMVDEADAVLQANRRLLQIADLFAVPVLLTEQYPQGLGPTEETLLAAYDRLPDERRRRISKDTFSCCGDGGFDSALDELRPELGCGERQILVAGIEAHICVQQTVLGLLARGEEVHLCWEAVSARGRSYRRSAIEAMAAAGAQLSNHESAGFAWAGDKNHPSFREMSALLRGGQVASELFD